MHTSQGPSYIHYSGVLSCTHYAGIPSYTHFSGALLHTQLRGPLLHSLRRGPSYTHFSGALLQILLRGYPKVRGARWFYCTIAQGPTQWRLIHKLRWSHIQPPSRPFGDVGNFCPYCRDRRGIVVCIEYQSFCPPFVGIGSPHAPSPQASVSPSPLGS